MRRSVSQLLVLVLVTIGCRATTFDEEDGVIVLNDKNLDEAIRQFPNLFVDFYLPWCYHCKQLEPVYIEVARAARAKGLPVQLAKLNILGIGDWASERGLKMVPTLHLFESGRTEPIEFKEQRTKSKLMRWLKKKLISDVDVLDSAGAAWDLLNDNELVALGFFKDRNGLGAKAFFEVAAENLNYAFALGVGHQIYNDFDVSYDRVIVLKQFDEGRADMTDSVTSYSLASFLGRHRYPLIAPYHPERGIFYYSGVDGLEVKRFIILFVDKTSPDFQTTVNGILPVAHAFRGELVVIYYDVTREDQFRKFVGVSVAECPVIIFLDKKGTEEKKFKLTSDQGQLIWTKVQRFVRDAIAGKIEPYYKSMPVPSDWDSKPVKELVGQNFDRVVLDTAKNVFVEFYDESRIDTTTTPLWNDLAAYFVHRSDLVFAKIDLLNNDVREKLGVPYRPTFVYYSTDDKEGVALDYVGDHRNLTLPLLIDAVNNGGKAAPQQVKTEL